QQVLGVILIGVVAEVERSEDHFPPIDDKHLVVHHIRVAVLQHIQPGLLHRTKLAEFGVSDPVVSNTPATCTPAFARSITALPITSLVNEKARKWIDCWACLR